jgi:hypothetical protein
VTKVMDWDAAPVHVSFYSDITWSNTYREP